MSLVARKYPSQLHYLQILTCSRIGAFGISFILPIIVYLMTFLCNDMYGCPVPSVLSPKTLTLEKLKEETGWPGFDGLVNLEVIGWVLGYYLLSLVLNRVLPGQEVVGTELVSGGRLNYKFNS